MESNGKGKKICFFYDESAHSRKITSKSINEENFRYDFVSFFIGVPEDSLEFFESEYLKFETKWKEIFQVKNELKSTSIGARKYLNGVASFKQDDIDLYIDLFQLTIDFDIYIHFGIFNKVEYLIEQLLPAYKISDKSFRNSLVYSMTKSLCVYQPKKVFEAIESNQKDNFLPLYKEFLKKRIDLNQRKHGESENSAFQSMSDLINHIDNNIELEWNYTSSFIGFKKYLSEMKISTYTLLMDKEGIGKTASMARASDIKNVSEAISINSIGIRCADFLAGFVSNMVNALQKATNYSEDEVGIDDRVLDEKWFMLNERQFHLYKLAYMLFIKQHNAWYKIYNSRYCDGIIFFISFLNYINSFSTFEDYQKRNIKDKPLELNSTLVLMLAEYLDRF